MDFEQVDFVDKMGITCLKLCTVTAAEQKQLKGI